MTSTKLRYFHNRIQDDYGIYFGIVDKKTKKQIACTIYWQISPSEQVSAKRDAARIVAALNAYRPDQEAMTSPSKPRFIYGPDSEGVNDLFVVQDSKTGKDLACTIHWGDGEEVKAEHNILLITKALNTYRLAQKRRD
jgi:hypothetical protein